MGKFSIVSGLILAGLVIFLVGRALPNMGEIALLGQQSNETEINDFAKATDLIKSDKYDDAIDIVQRYKTEMESLSENGLRWMELFIKGAEGTRDVPQLTVLFEFFPEIFKEHETASLQVADAYISNNRERDYKKIRSLWDDRETKIAAWHVLDVDYLLLQGRREEAVELLKSRTFKDKADVGRLVRLALLYTEDDPKAAWSYLGEAFAKDPQNYDVRMYRGKLLESVGKNNLAHKEYLAATRLNPQNLFLKDQLADFYVRQRQYSMALDIWKDNLSPPSIDAVWVKALFWGKITTPISFDFDETPAPQGKLEPLIQFLTGLEPGEFWDETKFERLAKSNYYLKTQQETYWLRLFQALKNKKEKEAMKVLKYSPFLASSWHPQVETALKRILNYRLKGTLELEVEPLAEKMSRSEEISPFEPLPFFQLLEDLSIASAGSDEKQETEQKIMNLLSSNEVFSAVLLTAGWLEAGLAMHQLPIIPNDFPDWVALNVTKALQHNRGIQSALEFASVQKQTPDLTLLTAELLLAGGDSEEALSKFNKLAKLDSRIGYRAAWLASLLYIERKDWQNARNSILAQPLLVGDVLGQETLARIAHLEGDMTLADKLYSSIEKKSAEARSYLARKAFSQKDWARARDLTQRLIEDYPDNLMLQENLNTINLQLQKENS